MDRLLYAQDARGVWMGGGGDGRLCLAERRTWIAVPSSSSSALGESCSQPAGAGVNRRFSAALSKQSQPARYPSGSDSSAAHGLVVGFTSYTIHSTPAASRI